MEKNNLVLFLSKLKHDAKISTYRSAKGDECIQGLQTNEAAVKYCISRLNGKAAGGLQKIIMLCTRQVDEHVVLETYSGRETTSRQYFTQQIQKFCAEKRFPEPEFLPVYYVGDDTSADASLQTIIDIVERTDPDSTVFFDSTGGFRNATMLMVIVMRLLEYMGRKTGDIYYSSLGSDGGDGKIESVVETYNLLNLISGVDEFSRFGSVKNIRSYFNYSAPDDADVKRLLEAMDKLSDNLKTCRVSPLKNSVKKLRKAIKEFKSSRTDRQSRLFADLLDTVEDKYRIFTEAQKPCDYVRAAILWCLDAEQIQQALTYYIDYFFQIIFDNHILYAKCKTDKPCCSLVSGANPHGTRSCLYYDKDAEENGKKSYKVYANTVIHDYWKKYPCDDARFCSDYDPDKVKTLMEQLIPYYIELNNYRDDVNHALSSRTADDLLGQDIRRMIETDSLQRVQEFLNSNFKIDV